MVIKPPGVSPVRCAVRMLFYSVQTKHVDTLNPFAHFVGEEEAPQHVCYVEGRLHLVRAGWSKAEAKRLLLDFVEEVLSHPERFVSPAFALDEMSAIRRAVASAERNYRELEEALMHMTPNLANEVRRRAGNLAWSRWAHDSVQTELHSALTASVAALAPDAPYPSEFELSGLMEEARSIRIGLL